MFVVPGVRAWTLRVGPFSFQLFCDFLWLKVEFLILRLGGVVHQRVSMLHPKYDLMLIFHFSSFYFQPQILVNHEFKAIYWYVQGSAAAWTRRSVPNGMWIPDLKREWRFAYRFIFVSFSILNSWFSMRSLSKAFLNIFLSVRIWTSSDSRLL